MAVCDTQRKSGKYTDNKKKIRSYLQLPRVMFKATCKQANRHVPVGFHVGMGSREFRADLPGRPAQRAFRFVCRMTARNSRPCRSHNKKRARAFSPVPSDQALPFNALSLFQFTKSFSVMCGPRAVVLSSSDRPRATFLCKPSSVTNEMKPLQQFKAV